MLVSFVFVTEVCDVRRWTVEFVFFQTKCWKTNGLSAWIEIMSDIVGCSLVDMLYPIFQCCCIITHLENLLLSSNNLVNYEVIDT